MEEASFTLFLDRLEMEFSTGMLHQLSISPMTFFIRKSVYVKNGTGENNKLVIERGHYGFILERIWSVSVLIRC